MGGDEMSNEEMLLPYKDYGHVCNVCLKVLGRPMKNPKCTKHLHYLRCGDCERWFPPGSLKNHPRSEFCICSNCISIRKEEDKKRKRVHKLRAELSTANKLLAERGELLSAAGLAVKDGLDRIATLNTAVGDLESYADELEAKVTVLQGALRPFIGKRREHDDSCLYCGWGMRNHEKQCTNPKCSLTIRAARALCDGGKENNDETD